jgi:uncharacterized protein YdhG (YjbR/CyaY superfamily)
MAVAKKTTKSATTTKRATATTKTYDGFTEEERGAMKDRAKELKAARGAKVDEESQVLATIAAMPPADRAIAQKIHDLIKANAPELSPRLWYGMPAYAKNGKVLCHFQPALKFKTRYPTLGFSDQANLDSGAMWPVAYAITEWSTADEKKLATLLKKAVR